MIDLQEFGKWMTCLEERFGRTMSDPTRMLYYNQVSERLSTEQFTKAAEQLFYEAERFPSPSEIVELAKAIAPAEVYQLPASHPKAYADMSDVEREEYRQGLAKVRKAIESLSAEKTPSGFHRLSDLAGAVQQEIGHA